MNSFWRRTKKIVQLLSCFKYCWISVGMACSPSGFNFAIATPLKRYSTIPPIRNFE